MRINQSVVKIVLALFICLSGYSQNYNLEFTCIDSDKGLSDNSVTYITQDSTGVIWIGTYKGLNQFDGHHIKTYNHVPNDSNSLTASHVSDIYVTSNNQVLVTTHEGLSIYNRELDHFDNYLLKTDSIGFHMQNYMNDINQDEDGTIWIASSGGLYQFDLESKTFHDFFNYSIFSQLSPEDVVEFRNTKVPGYIIEKLEAINNKFFSNREELSEKIKQLIGEIDHQAYSDIILRLLIENNDMFYSASVNEFIFDGDDIWLGLSNGHIVRVNKKNATYEVVYVNLKPEVETIIFSLFLEDSLLWVGSNSKSKLFDIKEKEIYVSPKPGINKILAMRDVAFFNTPSKDLWVATNKGLVKYNKLSDELQIIRPSYFEPKSLSSELISYVFIDMQNNVWVGSKDGGVCKLEQVKNFKKFVKKPSKKQPEVDNYVTAILEDTKGQVWVGYYAGGIDVYNSKGNIIRTYNDENRKIETGTITGIVQDKDGIVWASTYLQGLQKYISTQDKFVPYLPNLLLKENLHIMQLICDKDNNLWMGSLGTGIVKLDETRSRLTWLSIEDSLYNSVVRSNWSQFIYADPVEGIILSTENSLTRISADGQQIRRIWNSPLHFKSFSTCLYIDSVKNYFLGTSEGLFLIKTLENNHKEFKSRPIISNCSVINIIGDKKGNLWVSTNKGLYKVIIDPEEFLAGISPEFTHYKTEDGLPSNFFSRKTAFRAENGDLLFGTKNGFTRFTPDLIKQDDFSPNVVITGFKLFNKPESPGPDGVLKKHISQTKYIELKHNQNFISFEFAALDFINPNSNEYAYILEGVDETWNYIGNKREANYTNLSPGRYVFKVKASNHDKVWNSNVEQISLKINKPFWKTNMAMVVYTAVFILILWFFNYLIRYQEKLKSKLQLDRLSVEKDNEVNKMKLQFFTNISHEFRTPLTLIIGPLENLMQKNKESKEYQLIYRNAKKLMGLIDQIMDIRKLNSGKMQLNMKDCDIVILINELIHNFEYQCKGKQIKLHYHHDIDKLNTLVDPAKFETIVTNLLSNAIKHTPKGGDIVLKINSNSSKSDIPVQAQNGYYSIEVSDTGSGIPEEDIDLVFERFYQAKTKNDGGSGIGLTLVKELTELHGGKVTVESKLNEGSIFTAYFPVILESDSEYEQVDLPEVNTAPEHTNEVDVKPEDKQEENDELDIIEKQFAAMDAASPLILIVEDNDEVRNYIISELKSNYRLLDAVNGVEGFNLAIENYPDIIISDIMMPEMDGLELSKKLKTNEQTSHIPIILLTAYDSENNNVAGYETGADSFLAKPFSPKVLKSRIDNILRNRERLKEKFSSILYSIPDNKQLNSVDEQFLKKAIQIVEENLVEEKFNIDFLCKEMGYSRTALYSKIKALTDQPISEFIKLIRLKKATDLFREGKKSINEVAFLVGFKTHSHFSRCFNEEFGMSPKEYQEKLAD